MYRNMAQLYRNNQIIDVTKECTFEWYQEPVSCYAFLEVSGASGDFTDGETVTGQNSGATATVFSSYVDGGRVYVENVSGTFEANETIKGSESNQTATVDEFVAERSYPDNITHGTFPDSIISKDIDDYLEIESTLSGAGYPMKLIIKFPTEGIYQTYIKAGIGLKICKEDALKDIKATTNPGSFPGMQIGPESQRLLINYYDRFFSEYPYANPTSFVKKDVADLLDVLLLCFYQSDKGTFRWCIRNIRVLKLVI